MIIADISISLPIITLGAITGMTYGILAVGLVLIFRSNKIINFAHGEIGAFGAAVLGVTVREWGLPYWVAFAMAIAVSAAVAAVAEVAVVRRLRNAPNLMSIVATLGVAQFLLVLSFVVNSTAGTSSTYPQPPGLPEFDLGDLHITPAYSGMLLLTPLVVAGLALFFKRSRYGLAIRAAADNPDAARLSSVFAARMSTLSWALAGAVSAFTAAFVIPTRAFVTAQSLGPGLLLRALLAAVIARMTSFPIALAAGVLIGVAEQVLLTGYPTSGVVEMALFVGIVGTLLLRSKSEGRDDEKGSWAAVQGWPPLPDALRRVVAVRRMPTVFAAVALVVALVLPQLMSNHASVSLTFIVSVALIALSVGIVTGLAGQLSLGQFAIAGVGAAVSHHLTFHTGNYFLGFTAAALAGAAISVLVGSPALRIRGLMLAVTSLSFALAAEAWLLQQPAFFGGGIDNGRPIIGGLRLDTGRSYYYFALFILLLGLMLARNIWRGGLGRRFRAVRDNEDSARAFAISPFRVKLEALALAGVLAGIGGATLGHTLARVTAQDFPVSAGIGAVAVSVVGGIGILVGPIVGALYIIGVPRFLPLDSAGLAATQFGWLLLILYFPGGIAQILRPVRDRTAAWLARRSKSAVAAEPTPPTEQVAQMRVGALRSATPSNGSASGLRVEGMTKSFGGIDAVQGVSLEVAPSEILGLIGPNGAGKTTLFELISGFTRPDAGTVELDGTSLTKLSADGRAGCGLIRSFQDCLLFPTLTVREALMLAHERETRTRFVPSVLGLHRAEREKHRAADELAERMGLASYRDTQIRELSTGTRRITELACLVALQPRVLLLDEPSAGVAQRETEVLGELLANIRTQLGTTMVIIEHDIPMVMSIADRVIAMESGRVLAEGSPAAIQADPVVIASYLGTDKVATERSGTRSTNGTCAATTRAGAPCTRRAGADGLCGQHRTASV